MEIRVRRSEDRNNQLFHSDTFLGEEFSDELYHWKYVKREKLPSGKYRYYYDKDKLKDDLGFDEKARYEDSKLIRDSYKRRENEEYDKFIQTMDFINRNDSGASRYSDYDDNYKMATKYYSAAKDYERLRRRADEHVNERWNEYRRTPIGKLDVVISKGKEFINKLKRQ